MGQKTHPTSFRLGTIYTWKSTWFHKKKYADYLLQDIHFRTLIEKKLRDAAVARVEIERSEKETKISIFSSRPGIIIGRGGTGIEELKKYIISNLPEDFQLKNEIKINIEEIRNPATNAKLVGLSVAEQLEKRVSFRRALKQALDRTAQADGVKGVKIMVSGRLNGAEMSRREWLSKGKMPLHTIRADIDFARVNAYTTYGLIGVKVWIYKGEIFGKDVPSTHAKKEDFAQKALQHDSRKVK